MGTASFFARLRERLRMQRLQRADPNAWRIERLRRQGARIGEGCLIFTMEFSTEPYLVTIGHRVVIAGGTQLITHDGGVWLLRDEHPRITVFGRIEVGDNTFIGINCILLPNTTIGRNCIIGAGAVVRGTVPDDSVVIGNPGKVVMKSSLVTKMYLGSRDRLDTKHMTPEERERCLREHYGIPDPPR